MTTSRTSGSTRGRTVTAVLAAAALTVLTACSPGASESSDVVVRGDAGATPTASSTTGATPTASSTTSATTRATATATSGSGACPTYFAYDWTVTADRRGTTRVVTFLAPTNPAGWSTFTDQPANDNIQWILTGKSGNCTYIYETPAYAGVTFNANGGDATGTMAEQLDQTVASSGTSIRLTPNAFTRPGYAFLGWATSARGQKAYEDGAPFQLTMNTTLYASWVGLILSANDGSGRTVKQAATTNVPLTSAPFSRSGRDHLPRAPASGAGLGSRSPEPRGRFIMVSGLAEEGVVMLPSSVVRALAPIGLAVAATAVLITPAQAALPSAPARATGDVMIILDDSFQGPMFKGGVFMYGASEVSVAMGDSGQLSAIFPLNGVATATSKTIVVDPETGGLEFFNGPAETSAGLGSLVIRRSGSTGTITSRISGPYSAHAGQYSQTMPVFATTAVRTRKRGSGWVMQANLALTGDSAA